MSGFRGEVAAASLKQGRRSLGTPAFYCFRGEVAAASLKLYNACGTPACIAVSAAKSPRPH